MTNQGKPCVIAIIQARTGSTRLPRKALRDIYGETMLARVVTRARRAVLLDGVVVATTTKPEDDAIVAEAERLGAACFRGSEEDLLDRYYRAACSLGADVVVRITSDCPLTDPGIVDRVVREFLERQPGIHCGCNNHPQRTFPLGLDVTAVRFDALERAWREDDDPARREHAMLYITRNPGLFRVHSVTNETDLSGMRWTVDTAEDLEFVRLIYGHFGNDRFSWREALALLEKHPDWIEINRHVRQRDV